MATEYSKYHLRYDVQRAWGGIYNIISKNTDHLLEHGELLYPVEVDQELLKVSHILLTIQERLTEQDIQDIPFPLFEEEEAA